MDWIVWAAVAGSLVLFALISQNSAGPSDRQRRIDGTGRYARYGPNASDERIAELDRAYGQYRAGVGPFIRGSGPHGKYIEWWKAIRLWEDSARYECVEAQTALGINAFLKYDTQAAIDRWVQAADRGYAPAKILLDLTRVASPVVPPGLFIKQFLYYENPEGGNTSSLKHESGEFLVGVALSLGYRDYADEIAALLRSNPRGYST